MLRIQTVPLPAEPYGQPRYAQETALTAVLVHGHAPSLLYEEEFLCIGNSEAARPQELYDNLGNAS